MISTIRPLCQAVLARRRLARLGSSGLFDTWGLFAIGCLFPSGHPDRRPTSGRPCHEFLRTILRRPPMFRQRVRMSPLGLTHRSRGLGRHGSASTPVEVIQVNRLGLRVVSSFMIWSFTRVFPSRLVPYQPSSLKTIVTAGSGGIFWPSTSEEMRRHLPWSKSRSCRAGHRLISLRLRLLGAFAAEQGGCAGSSDGMTQGDGQTRNGGGRYQCSEGGHRSCHEHGPPSGPSENRDGRRGLLGLDP